MNRKQEEKILKIIILTAVVVVTIFIGKFGFGLNVLPTCSNGSIAPFGDASKCSITEAVPTVVNGVTSTTNAVCPDPNTTYDSSSGACLFKSSSALASCINSGGSWNSATSVCTAPVQPKQIVVNTTNVPQYQCVNGMIVSNPASCPIITQNQTIASNNVNTTNSENSSFTPVFVVIIVAIVIGGAYLILRKR